MKKIFFKFLGQEIRKVRKEKNMKLDHMANYLGVEKKSYVNMEGGNSTISKNTLFKICDELKINPTNLLQKGLAEFIKVIPKDETTTDIYEFTTSFIEDVIKTKEEEIENRVNIIMENLYNAVFQMEKSIATFPFLSEKERYEIVDLLTALTIKRIEQIQEGE